MDDVRSNRFRRLSRLRAEYQRSIENTTELAAVVEESKTVETNNKGPNDPTSKA